MSFELSVLIIGIILMQCISRLCLPQSAARLIFLPKSGQQRDAFQCSATTYLAPLACLCRPAHCYLR